MLGPEDAAALMAHLPPLGWGDVATKADVTGVDSSLRAEIANVKAELRAELAEVRTDLAKMHTDIRGEINSQSRTLLVAMFGLFGTAVGALLAAPHLG